MNKYLIIFLAILCLIMVANLQNNNLSNSTNVSNIKNASDKAVTSGVSILSSPFHRPFQYVGMTINEAAKLTGGVPNSVKNIIIDNDKVHMLLEAEGNFVSYVDVELKETQPCSLTTPFDSEVILGALSINPAELEMVSKKTHFHTYYDHKHKLKVGVSCSYEGGPLSVGFSSKYYGM